MKGIFITCRSGSSRLPNKCYANIDGRMAIEYCIDTAKKSKLAELICLCTTTLPNDDGLCVVANDHNIEYFRGPSEDKLERWRQAAEFYEVDAISTFDADDIFMSIELIDAAFDLYDKSQPDIITAKNTYIGAFTYLIKTAALERMCHMKGTTNTEMGMFFFEKLGVFDVAHLPVPKLYHHPEIRCTLDYRQDLEFFRCVIREFNMRGWDLRTDNILNYLITHPNICQINVHLTEKWAANQKAKTTMTLKENWEKFV